MSLKEDVDQILSGKMSFDDLSTLIKSGSPFERINAIRQIAKQFPSESPVVLETAAKDPKNRVEMWGYTIQLIAISSLLSTRGPNVDAAARRIISGLPVSEQQDLVRLLKTEGLHGSQLAAQ